jgi:hypothetical protein
VEKISVSLGRILEHLEKLSTGSEKPSGGIGEARVEGLRDKGSRLGRIEKF